MNIYKISEHRWEPGIELDEAGVLKGETHGAQRFGHFSRDRLLLELWIAARARQQTDNTKIDWEEVRGQKMFTLESQDRSSKQYSPLRTTGCVCRYSLHPAGGADFETSVALPVCLSACRRARRR